MSYPTFYSLEYDTPDDYEEIKDFILKDIDYFADFEIEDLMDGGGVTASWYDHEEDMLNLSRGFPATIFILRGTGEEQGDMWKKRFINGGVEVVQVEMTFPDFAPLPEEEEEEE